MSLVKFKSKAAADIIMFEEHARLIFDALHIPLQPQGVIEAADIPAKLGLLQAAIEQHQAQPSQPQANPAPQSSPHQNEEAPEQPEVGIGFAQRAHPLKTMLGAAADKKVDVHWGF